MTLEEAIEHAEQTAASCGGECADDHWQLAEWLRELRRARTEIDLLKTLRDGFKADAQKYKAENAKLKEIVRDDSKTFLELGYAHDRVDELWDENRKLRELVEDMWHDGMCDCDEFSHSIGVCVKCEYGYPERMRDLGIEVD